MGICVVKNESPSSFVLYPVFLDLRNITALLVGGGEVAHRKAADLLQCGCLLTVVSPKLIPAFEEFLSLENFRWEARVYENGEARNYGMVLSATDEPEVNQRVYHDAKSCGCLVNVVDRPDLCTFFVPSVARRNTLQIAISTGGKCPALARHLRMQLDEIIPEQYGALVEKLEIIRGYIKEKIVSQKERRTFITRIVSSSASQEFLRGNEALLDAILKGWKHARSRSTG